MLVARPLRHFYVAFTIGEKEMGAYFWVSLVLRTPWYVRQTPTPGLNSNSERFRGFSGDGFVLRSTREGCGGNRQEIVLCFEF